MAPNIPFFENEHIAGISLEEDFDLVTQLRNHFDRLLNRSPSGFIGFPVKYPSQLKVGDIPKLSKNKPFLVSPKPQGVHYLLYTDRHGTMFMENRAQHIFKVVEDGAPQLIPEDSVLEGIVARKIVREGATQKANLTFVILDAKMVKGRDLTNKSVKQRISTIQASFFSSLNPIIRSITFYYNKKYIEGDYRTTQRRHQEQKHQYRRRSIWSGYYRLQGCIRNDGRVLGR